ncbi:MAG: hypothetical protein HFJ59_04060 [Clostridia bacterium]|nr:hypothetical protein [Clostridia bacterium]
MNKLLGLADIRDWIKSLNYTASENCYIGKLDNKKDKSIGVYQLKTSYDVNIAIGGIDNTKTLEKSVSILIHWNKNAKETEQKSQEIYNKLLTSRDFIINDIKVNYIRLLIPEPVDVGTDDKNIYERVIQAIFYYENKEKED